jgi:hypothetical protein
MAQEYRFWENLGVWRPRFDPFLPGSRPESQIVKVNQMQIERIINGKIIEHWRQSDNAQNMGL